MIIPADWKNKRILLFLERAHTEDRLWLDDTEIGMQNSMVTPHQFDLTGKITPGRHILSLCIDNRIKDINVGANAHSLTDHTQGNWNGVTGTMELSAKPLTYFDDIQVYPDLKQRTAHVHITINAGAGAAAGKVNISARSFNRAQIQVIYADFPEFNFIGRLLTEKYYIASEQRTNLLRNGTVIERYHLLLQMHPDIISRVHLWMVASHLNVSHEALCRIRGQQVSAKERATNINISKNDDTIPTIQP